MRRIQPMTLARRIVAGTIGQVYDIRAMIALRDVVSEYVPVTGAAMRPAAIHAMVNDVIINGRKSLIEFGAGVSTLMLAVAAARTGGRLLSVEHNADWAAAMNDTLARLELRDAAEVVHAELEEEDLAGNRYVWYSRRRADEATAGRTFDFMLCDGPPAFQGPTLDARYPAGPYVADKLQERSIIFLDDIDRAGERQIARRWEALLGRPFKPELIRGSFSYSVIGEYFYFLP